MTTLPTPHKESIVNPSLFGGFGSPRLISVKNGKR